MGRRQGVVVHEHRGITDVICPGLGNVEVEDGLDRCLLDRCNSGGTIQGPYGIARLEVPRHGPAAAGQPEPVESARHDGVAVLE